MNTADPIGYDRYVRDTLSVFLEKFVEKRVALLVTDSSETAIRLAAKAASLQVVHPESAFERVELDGVRLKQLPPDGSPLLDDPDSYTAILVPEIRVLGEEAPRRIVELDSLLEEDGVLVVGTTDTGATGGKGSDVSASEDAMGYQELYRTLSERFPVVQVLGQAPFLGTSIYNLSGDGDATEIGFDSSLVEGRSELPLRVLLVCSRDDLPVEPFTVVQAATDGIRVLEGFFNVRRANGNRHENDDQHGDDQHGREIQHLETLLEARGAQLRLLERELAEKVALARDLTQRLREGRPAGRGEAFSTDEVAGSKGSETAEEQARKQLQSEARRLRTELEAASARALEAEAARVDAVMRLDEVSGHLALTEVAPTDVVEALERERAALLGTVRGMRSAVIELEESRDAAEARLVLAMHDLDDARGRTRILERQLEEMREHFEMELAKTSRSVSGGDAERWEQERTALAGERNGLRARCLDVEQSVDELLVRNESLQRSTGALEERIETLQASVAGLTASESVLKARLAEVENEQEQAKQREDDAAECHERIVGLQQELAEREGRIEQMQTVLGRGQSELIRLSGKLEANVAAAEQRAEAAESRSEGLREALEEAREAFLALAESLTKGNGKDGRSADSSEINVDQLDPGEGNGGK